MGFLRWAAIIGTGGLAPVKGTSPRERTAKAAEKQVRLQRQMAGQTTMTGQRWKVYCPHCKQGMLAPLGSMPCPGCGGQIIVVRRGIRTHAEKATPPVLDGRGRVIAQPSGHTSATASAASRPTAAAAAADAARAQALTAGAAPEEAQAEAASAALAHAVGRPYSPAMTQDPGEDIASKLGRLADLHSGGALTDDEFAAAKAKILGS